MSVIRATASFEAVGMMEARGVAVNCGNLKFMLAASLWPSGHSLESGVPSTEQILNISSISELPGNRGLKQFYVVRPQNKIGNRFQIFPQILLPSISLMEKYETIGNFSVWMTSTP